MRLNNSTTKPFGGRWFQMAAVLIAMIMIANLQYGWTLFVRPIEHDHGWSLAKVQWAFTLFIMFQTWVQPLDGWLIDRLGPRIFFTFGAILSGLGWTALAFVTSLTQLYAAYAVAGVGSALVYSGSIGSALKWFRDRRGLAAGSHRRRLRRRSSALHSDHRAAYRRPRLPSGIRLDRHRPGTDHPRDRSGGAPSSCRRHGRYAGESARTEEKGAGATHSREFQN